MSTSTEILLARIESLKLDLQDALAEREEMKATIERLEEQVWDLTHWKEEELATEEVLSIVWDLPHYEEEELNKQLHKEHAQWKEEKLTTECMD